MGDGGTKAWQEAFADMVYWKWEGEPPEWSIPSTAGLMVRTLQLQPGAGVLDLGCGLGHYAIELARRGYEVTGLEYSEPFLKEARRRVHEASVELRLVQGDMARMEWEGEYDAVLLWGNTFGMLGDEENRRTLAGIARALGEGGLCLIDTQNYATLPEKLEKGWEFHREDKDLLILTEGTRDLLPARFGVTVTTFDLRTGERHTMPFSWRLYLLPELERVAADAGLTLRGIYGDDPKVVDWKSWKRGEPKPYSTEGFTGNAAKRILLCRK